MDFLILALATFRISSVIADEDGPFGLFEWGRGLIGVKRDDQGENYGTNNFAVGLVCQWCNSVWIGIILTILYIWFGKFTVWMCFPFALSAVALILAGIAKLLQRCGNG